MILSFLRFSIGAIFVLISTLAWSYIVNDTKGRTYLKVTIGLSLWFLFAYWLSA